MTPSDPLGPWRDDIPAKIRAGGWKARYWKVALKLGRIPTFSEEKDAGL